MCVPPRALPLSVALISSNEKDLLGIIVKSEGARRRCIAANSAWLNHLLTFGGGGALAEFYSMTQLEVDFSVKIGIYPVSPIRNNILNH